MLGTAAPSLECIFGMTGGWTEAETQHSLSVF